MAFDDQHSDLIGSIYDCSMDKTLWPAVLGRICREMEGHIADLRAFDANDGTVSLSVTYNWDDELLTLTQQNTPLNPLLPVSLVVTLDEPFCGSRDTDISAMHRSLYIQRSGLKERGHDDVMTVPTERSVTRVSYWGVYNREVNGPLGIEHLAFAQAVTPHIRRAVQISGLLNQGTVVQTTLRNVLAALPAAALIVGPEGEIQFANPAAVEELGTKDIIADHHGKLRPASQELSSFLRSLMAGTLGQDFIAEDMTGRCLHVTGVRLASSDEAPGSFLIVLRSPDADLTTPIGTAARVHGLTLTEVRVLKLIVEGRSLEDAAAVLGIARSTVKTHLDALYVKCGVNSRAKLAAKIAGLIGPITAPNAAMA